MQRPFDLVILDLDGTILHLYRSEPISPAVRATVAAVQRAGIPVTIGTGRTFDYVRTHYAELLQLRTPFITTQGAVIGDPVTGRVLSETTMPIEAARQIAHLADGLNQVTVFYFNDEDGHTHLYQNNLTSPAQDVDFHDHVFGAPRQRLPSLLAKLNSPVAHPPIKFIIDNNLAHTPDLLPELHSRFGELLYITRTHPRLLEGTAWGVHKGRGVQELCHLLQIDPQRVLAIGDNDNDIPLLQAVGYGVAMGNATPGVKAVARWIAPPIEEDGAAVALQQLILDGRTVGETKQR
jgi:hypothetical protein